MAALAHDAFTAGDPAQAWAVMQETLDLARIAILDAARWRFRANFGTSACEGCRGLHAGEGVRATCYQAGQCYYDNFKVTLSDRVVDSMLRDQGDKD